MVAARSGPAHLAAQQHLVAHDQGADRVRIALGESDAGFDLDIVLGRLAGQPDALQNLQAVFGGDRRHLLDALVVRIGADAVSDLGELAEVFVDLRRRDPDVGIEGRLAAAKRCVGHAPQFLPRPERGVRHGHRRAEPGPGANDHGRCEGQANQTDPHTRSNAGESARATRLIVPGHALPSAASSSAARAPAALKDETLKCWTKDQP